MLKKLKKCEWQIAIRLKRDKLLFEENGCREQFKPIKNTLRYWCADPFIVDYDNQKYLFFELYDRLKRKGLIGYRKIVNGKFSRIYKAFESKAHLSYPFVFTDKDRLYLIPESNNLNSLILLENIPNKKRLEFRESSAILNNAVADSTFFVNNNSYYMLTTPVSDADNTGELLLYCYNGINFVAAKCNPVITDKASARMAGKIIYYDNSIIRCSQDCSKTYGGGINFSIITACSDTEYSEKKIGAVYPKDVNILGVTEYDGIHTYNFDSKYEVIDFKRNAVFSFCECIGYLLEKLHITKKIKRK